MLTLNELQGYLDELLQVKLFQDYCPNGLQVEGCFTITHIAVGVSASLETINKAIESKAQALIVHHGIFWNREPFLAKGIGKAKLQALFDHGLSLFAYHLPLDAHQLYGNNWKAAQELGWKDLAPFSFFQGMPMGVKGTFPPMAATEFRAKLEAYYQHPAHCALGGKEMVQSAALISGGAHKQIGEAIQAEVDCFVTGSFDEPIWHQAFEGGINFFAMGHSATEKVGPYALGKHLGDKFQIQVTLIDEPNPF
jgi:dinuclear metal center YbgI/SA1388 family protein